MQAWLAKNGFRRGTGCLWFHFPEPTVCYKVWLHGENGQAEILVNDKRVHRCNSFKGALEAQQFFYGA